jgi:hypothetical protein
MENTKAVDGLALTKLIVLVERHLQFELRLLEQLDELNQMLKVTLEAAGSRGLTAEQTTQLNLTADNLSKQSDDLRGKRQATLAAINANRNASQPRQSIRQFIQTLDKASGSRLETLRGSILDRLVEVHATLLGNQAVMFYSYDFYRKMVAGLLKSDSDETQYSLTGQSAGVKPGNLFRKAV